MRRSRVRERFGELRHRPVIFSVRFSQCFKSGQSLGVLKGLCGCLGAVLSRPVGALVVLKLFVSEGLPRARQRLLVRAVIIVAVGGLVAGCASRAPNGPQTQAQPEPIRVASYEPTRRIRTENDGIEVQADPMKSDKPVVDDPREPFSPNYGRYIR